MGQCQNQKAQMKIDVLHIPSQDLHSDIPLQTCLYTYSLRNIKINKITQVDIGEGQISGLKSQSITFMDQNNQEIQLQCKKYNYLSSGLLFQNQGLQISQILTDQLHCDRVIYLVTKHAQPFSLLIRNFMNFQSQELYNTLHEINTYESISKLGSPYLHRMIKNYTIQPTTEFITNYSKIILLQPVSANLSLIIKHRKAIKAPWSISQFYVLMRNLVDSVATLHEAGLVHNDIRPSNIFYSSDKKCFLIGAFSRIMGAGSVLSEERNKSNEFYRDQKKPKDQISFDIIQDLNKKSDVYSLGMTLLSAFYLVLMIDRKKAAPYNRFYAHQYPFLPIIAKMICKIEKRSSIFEIKEALKHLAKKYELQNMVNIDLEDYQLISKDYVDIYKRERFIADAYKTLSLIGNWKERLKNRHIHKKISDNSVESAKYYQQLAVISSIQGKIQKSKNYYIHSAQIYYKIGYTNFIQRDFQNAITYFQQGLDNFRIVSDKEKDLVYIRLLVSLYEVMIVSGYFLVEPCQLTKLWRIVHEVKDIQPFAFLQYVLQLINIYKYYQDYNIIDDLLKSCLQVSPRVETKIGPISLEKMIIENNLKMAERKNRQSIHRRKIITQTDLKIFTILHDKQYYFISHPLQKIQLNLLSARAKKLKGATSDAINMLKEIAALMDNQFQDDQLDPTPQRNHYCTLKCEILSELGDIWCSLEELDESFQHYTKAVSNYKQFFGDIYNIECAVLLQKIGNIHKRKKNYDSFKDSIDLALRILKTEYGNSHKDIARLSQYKKKFSEKQSESSSTGSPQPNRMIGDNISIHSEW